MAEIKSTLEIIMEKTQGLTLSERDKKAFQLSQIQAKIRGLAQKLSDGLLNSEGLKEEMGLFEGEKQAMARDLLRKECLDRLDPEGANSPLLDALEQVLEEDLAPIQSILSNYYTEVDQERKKHMKIIMKRFRKDGIRGSAVVPNLHADPDWSRYIFERKEAFNRTVRMLAGEPDSEHDSA